MNRDAQHSPRTRKASLRAAGPGRIHRPTLQWSGPISNPLPPWTRAPKPGGCDGLVYFSASSRSTHCAVRTVAPRCASSQRSRIRQWLGRSSNASGSPPALHHSTPRWPPSTQSAARTTDSTISHWSTRSPSPRIPGSAVTRDARRCRSSPLFPWHRLAPDPALPSLAPPKRRSRRR
jgi:hypothetical protein